MNWRDWIPFTRSRAMTEASDLPVLRRQIEALKTETVRLEGLLDVVGDPDARLPVATNQAQGLFRTLSEAAGADKGRDFADAKRREILRLSHLAYALRGDAHNLLEIFIDFVIGDGLHPKADTTTGNDGADLQEVLDEIWTDPRNRLAERHENLTRNLLLEGELFQPADLSPIDGHLELGYLPPERVLRVLQDARGRDAFLEVDPPQAGTQPLLYFVLDNLSDLIAIERLPVAETQDEMAPRYRITETIVDPGGNVPRSVTKDLHGLAFGWFVNRPEGATRGRTELTEILDYIDIHDEHLWATVEREKLRKMFLLDVTIKDAKTDADIRKITRELGLDKPPDGPKVTAHNDQVEIKIQRIEDDSAADKATEQILRMNIYGAKGFPEFWSGAGADANLATAKAQEQVPLKRLRRKQSQVKGCWERLIAISLELRRRAKSTAAVGGFSILVTEVGGKDHARGATVLKDLALALTTASDVLGKEVRNHVLISSLREGGWEIPEEMEGVPEGEAVDALAAIDRHLQDNQDGAGDTGEDEEDAQAAA